MTDGPKHGGILQVSVDDTKTSCTPMRPSNLRSTRRDKQDLYLILTMIKSDVLEAGQGDDSD